MRLWKVLGVAGVAGVAATGAVLARNERQRRAYTPDDVRERLRERVAAAGDEPSPSGYAPIRVAPLTRLGRLPRQLAHQLPARAPFRRLARRRDENV